MDLQRRYILLFLALAITIVVSWYGLAGIVIVAYLATALTVGLRTGSLAPYYPTISRTESPVKFWLIMAICAAMVIANLVHLLWIAWHRLHAG